MKLTRTLMLAAIAAAAMVGNAYALTPEPDQTRVPPIRHIRVQGVNYIRFNINWNDPNISGGVLLPMSLPANAYILSIDADVTTAFNAGTTNSVSIGVTKSSANEIAAAGTTAGTNIVAGSTGMNHLTAAAGLGVVVTGNTSDQQGGGSIPAYVPVYAKYAQTGTAATAGAVTIIIAYVPNDDLQ